MNPFIKLKALNCLSFLARTLILPRVALGLRILISSDTGAKAREGGRAGPFKPR